VSGVRSSHAGKSREERETYATTVLRPAQEPTIETIKPSDRTEDVAPREQASTGRAVAPHRGGPTLVEWVREHSIGVVLGTVITALVGMIGYMAAQLFSMNRELGETKQRLTSLESDVEEQKASLTRETDRLERRLDHVADDAHKTPPIAESGSSRTH
jgi:hypothetical protein